MARHVIRISRKTGQVTFIKSDALNGLLTSGQAVSVRRASHVEPTNEIARHLFRLLRRLFGEDGIIGHFTREFQGLWQIDLGPSGGPVMGPFETRSEAIATEIRWLQDNVFLKGRLKPVKP